MRRSLGMIVPLALVGCAPLEEIELDVCGNGVVEAGEDCDRFTPTEVVDACAAALAGGQPGHCEFVCSPPDAASPCRHQPASDGGCPVTHTLGQDGICRRSTQIFSSEPVVRFDDVGTHLTVTELDGDPFPELAITNLQAASTKFIGLPSVFAGGQGLPSTGLLALGPLEGRSCRDGAEPCDATDEVVVPFTIGLGVFLGLDTGLQSKIYTSLPLLQGDVRAASIPFPVAQVPGLRQIGFAAVEEDRIDFLRVLETTNVPELVASLPIEGALVGEPLFADIKPETTTPRVPEMVAVTVDGLGELTLRVATLPDLAGHPASAPELISLGSGPVAGGPYAMADGVEAVALVVGGAAREVVTVSSSSYPTVERHALPAEASSVPLVLDYLNDDEVPDAILGEGIWVSLPQSSPQQYIEVYSAAVASKTATTADVDRNGRRDVVLSRPGGATILLGTNGYAFSPRPLTLAGEPSHFLVEDFNADGLGDVLAAVLDPNTESDPCPAYRLAVFASRLGGYEDGATELGTLTGLTQLALIDVNFGFNQDASADVALFTGCGEEFSGGVMLGTPAGLVSPFLLPPTVAELDGRDSVVALAAAVGDFGTLEEPGGDGRNDVAVVLTPFSETGIRLEAQLKLYRGLGDAELAFVANQAGRPLDELGRSDTGLGARGAEAGAILPVLTAADLFPADGDELVVVGSRFDDANQGRLLVVSAGEVVVSHTLPTIDMPIASRVRVVDFDLDGDLDVLAARVSAAPNLAIQFFENDGSTLLAPVDIPPGDFDFLADFVVLPPDWTPAGPVSRVLRVGLAGQQLCAWRVGTPLFDVSCEPLALEPLEAGLFNAAVALADLDADGLEDIVLSRAGSAPGETLVFPQCAASESARCAP